MKTITLGIVGGGQMAEAMANGIIAAGLIDAERIYISDHKPERCAYLTETYGVRAAADDGVRMGAYQGNIRFSWRRRPCWARPR